MNTTLKGLVPGETIRAHLRTKAGPFVDMRQQVPSAPLASGVADANGNLTLNLPQRQEVLCQRSNGTAIQINNATTQGSPL